MEQIEPQPSAPLLLAGTIFAFTPVPLQRVRADGWTPLAQERFIRALEVMGSVRAALRAVGISRNSAYKLRERPGADSFARAWDAALDFGRSRAFDVMLDRAMNGITTIRIRQSGHIDISGGPDLAILRGAMQEEPPPGTRVADKVADKVTRVTP